MSTNVTLYIQYDSKDGRCTFGPNSLERLGDNLYRVLCNTMEEEFDFQDVIEAEPIDDNTIRFVRVAEPGNWRIHCFGLSKRVIESDSLRSFLERCVTRGIHWERLWGGILYLSVPPGMDYDPSDDIKALTE